MEAGRCRAVERVGQRQRRHHRQDGLQIAADLFDGVGTRRGLIGFTVTTLIVEDHPDAVTPHCRQLAALKMEGAHAKTEAVGEDHRQWCVGIPYLTHSQVDTVRGSAAGVPARSEALPLVPTTPCMLRSTSVTRLIAGATGAAGAGSAVGSPGMPAGNCRPAVPGP